MKRRITALVIILLLLTASVPAYAVSCPIVEKDAVTTYKGYATNDALLRLIGQILGKTVPDSLQWYWDTANPIKNTPSCPRYPAATPVPSEKPEPTMPPAQNTPEPSENSLDAYAADVIALVNAERKNAGLSELQTAQNLTAAALVRAAEIKRSFSHTRPDGTSCFTVLKEQNVSYRGAGENIAMGQQSAQAVMKGWMNSAGHRENIRNANFTKIGVGCYQDAAGRLYWVQLFIY